MSLKSIKLPVPNSVLFIKGSSTTDIPTIDRSSVVWATPSCIAVGCMPDVDGDTRITIGCIQNEGIGEYLVFDGQLQTTSRVVSVEIVPGKMILKQNVPNGSTRIRIWVNHPVTPNDVVIGLG